MSASSAVNFIFFSDGAAFTATATQEDNLLGGGSLSNAGLPGGSARNVRSVAVQTNMNIDRVMKAGNWQGLPTPAETRTSSSSVSSH